MPDLDSITRFLETAAARGIGLTFLALLGLLIIGSLWMAVLGARKSVPKLLDAHLDFLETTKTNSTRTAAAMEIVSESTKRGDSKTHRALGHISTAMHMETNNPVVKSELQHAINLLRSE